MTDTPLASLSLTHVHYVSFFWFPRAFLSALRTDEACAFIVESERPALLFIGLACPSSPGIMRDICHSYLGHKRDGGAIDVRRPDGL